MRALSIVGARPQLVKASVVSRALEREHEHILVHTGQHYDTRMSDVFFTQLGIPKPDYHLGVGSGSHGRQTARMLEGIEAILNEQTPDVVIVFGDTNSTLAGALAAAKLHFPVAHIEAGLRSFNRRMPEEVNRVATDHMSSVLFTPTQTAVDNLYRESIVENVFLVGDVMYDVLREVQATLPDPSELLAQFALTPGSYHLATVHRAENTDDPNRLKSILQGLEQLDLPVVFPAHPRTRHALGKPTFPYRSAAQGLLLIEPVGYLQLIQLAAHARSIITDSGGLQKEAYLLHVPCVTVRDETEWEETLHDGWNVLVGSDPALLASQAVRQRPQSPPKPVFGSGDAAVRTVQILGELF